MSTFSKLQSEFREKDAKAGLSMTLAAYENKKDKTPQEMFELGFLYCVEKSYQKAFFWFEKAANQEHAPAQYMLAFMYDGGEGVAKNHEKAGYWYQKSANHGHAEAQYCLASIYYDDKGVEKDHKKAIYWYEEAANKGHASAQFRLALMYHVGEGVAKNYVEACKWLILAKAQSDEDDKDINEALDSLEQLMTPAQIAAAQELASQFEAQEE